MFAVVNDHVFPFLRTLGGDNGFQAGKFVTAQSSVFGKLAFGLGERAVVLEAKAHKQVGLTDGPSRTVKIGQQEIQLCRTTPRNMATSGRLSGLLMQAFRHLGKEHITPARVD